MREKKIRLAVGERTAHHITSYEVTRGYNKMTVRDYFSRGGESRVAAFLNIYLYFKFYPTCVAPMIMRYSFPKIKNCIKYNLYDKKEYIKKKNQGRENRKEMSRATLAIIYKWKISVLAPIEFEILCSYIIKCSKIMI